MLAMERWQGKVAVVTGASAGIGAVVVEYLLDHGVTVIGFARRLERLQELAERVKDKKGKFYHRVVDMTKEAEIVEGFKWIRNHIGPVAILINNAGIARVTSLVDGNTKFWKEVIDTNVVGLSIATKEAIGDMRSNNIDGHIININSVSGHQVVPMPSQNVYPASKFTLTALTETLRLDLVALNSKIKVTSISPGFVETEMFEATSKASKVELPKEHDFDSIPMLKSQDIADAVVYVLSTPPHVQILELTIKPVGESF